MVRNMVLFVSSKKQPDRQYTELCATQCTCTYNTYIHNCLTWCHLLTVFHAGLFCAHSHMGFIFLSVSLASDLVSKKVIFFIVLMKIKASLSSVHKNTQNLHHNKGRYIISQPPTPSRLKWVAAYMLLRAKHQGRYNTSAFMLMDIWCNWWQLNLPFSFELLVIIVKNNIIHCIMDNISKTLCISFDDVQGKGKGRVLATALLTWGRLTTRTALQSRKWQLIGMSNDTAAHYAAIHCLRQRSIRPAVCS